MLSFAALLISWLANIVSPPSPLVTAQKIIVVVTPGWSSPAGSLYAFARDGKGWRAQIASAEPIFVGKNGLAWGDGAMDLHQPGPHKRERDHRSPAGVFLLGPVFGAQLPTGELGLPLENFAHGVCVDDPKSAAYGRRFDFPVGERTWTSAEDLTRYSRAIVVQHNQRNKPGAGSCIFLHDGDGPTPGCTALPATTIDALIKWLFAEDHAVLVQLPRSEYDRIRVTNGLPILPAATAPECNCGKQ